MAQRSMSTLTRSIAAVSASPAEADHVQNDTVALKKPLFSNSVGALFEGVESGAVLRMTYVVVGVTIIIALYFAVKMYRLRGERWRGGGGLRRYDVLSAKELQPELVVSDEEDEDELYAAADHTKLMQQSSSPT